MILMAIAAMMVMTASSQVTISKFKFGRDEPFGMFPGRKMIDMKFKNTGDRPMKYLKVYYYAVNAVGDVVSGLDAGIRTEDMEYVKPKLLDCMGPFEPGERRDYDEAEGHDSRALRGGDYLHAERHDAHPH